MMISMYFLLLVLQLNSNIVLSQRDFPNPAVTDPAPCSCDLRAGICDPNCCCDPDCSDADLAVSPICNSIRTVTNSDTAESKLSTWNCSNSTSAELYDYFPFVCVELTLNEIKNEAHPTNNVQFVTSSDAAINLRSTFVTQHPELFQPLTLTSTISNAAYSKGAPIQSASNTLFKLPGNLVGATCQDVPVLFGVNRDVTCIASSITGDLCARINSVPTFVNGGGATSNINVIFYSTTYTTTTPTPPSSTVESYFQTSYTPTLSDISSTTGQINDYCSGKHPLTRTQRYDHACNSSNTNLCNSQYQIWNGCTLRNDLKYSTIPDAFFSAVRTTSIDGPTNFADFNNYTNASSISCLNNLIQRVFYRFNYSSIDNTISTVEVFVLYPAVGVTSINPRITIEWNDVATNPQSATTIPRGYLDGEVLQFRRNSAPSDVSSLVPTSDGFCVDATRQSLRYKQSTSSYCFIQLTQATVQQCHNLKLTMYLYLNAFYAPASGVLAYPSANATLIQIRDDTQDLLDLDRIDETRPDNQLSQNYITRTQLNTTTYTIYDTTKTLPVCYGVPSGVYIEFGFVRIQVSPTVAFERIVSVQYNYTYSNWQFDCTQSSCASTTTQKYFVSFQSAFRDLTNSVLDFDAPTKADLNSADNYIQHLLWLITGDYTGEPAYRNYTIAMILIFIAISVVVMHVLLFGIMLPF